MNPYMFVIKAIPMPENKDCEDIAGAIIHIWVIANDREQAKLRALDYIKKYLWKATSVERELEIQQEQIPSFHEAEVLLYRRAQEHGIAADFLAHPKNPGHPDDPVIMRRLELP